MEVIITSSARKHGITDEEIYEILENYTYRIDHFDTSRIPNLPDPGLYIGATSAGKWLEVMSYIQDDFIVFHCMPMRGKTLLRASELLEERKTQ